MEFLTPSQVLEYLQLLSFFLAQNHQKAMKLSRCHPGRHEGTAHFTINHSDMLLLQVI